MVLYHMGIVIALLMLTVVHYTNAKCGFVIMYLANADASIP